MRSHYAQQLLVIVWVSVGLLMHPHLHDG
jgi:hypothetical protein